MEIKFFSSQKKLRRAEFKRNRNVCVLISGVCIDGLYSPTVFIEYGCRCNQGICEITVKRDRRQNFI